MIVFWLPPAIRDLEAADGRGGSAVYLSAACPFVLTGMLAGGLPGGRGRPVGCGDRGAGQAAAAGGPVAASNRFIHPVWRCQPSGRCTVMWPRPWRAMRAATSMSWPRMVAPRAFAQDGAPRLRLRLSSAADRLSALYFFCLLT